MQRERVAREAMAFQPATVDDTKCLALLYNSGRGRLQCGHARKPGQLYCGRHCARRPHGAVRGPIPAQKMQLFTDKVLRPEKASNQWYARHLMWMYALEEDPELEHLRDLGPEQYESCLKKLNRMHATRSRLVGKLERGAGVRDLDDRGEGKFGSERECYNGRGGGRVFKWYSRAVFNNFLGRMCVSEATCSVTGVHAGAGCLL